jgi:hypothetical protein
LEIDWYKISVTFLSQATATALLGAGIYLRNASASETYLGDGVSGIYVWGAQFTESAKPLAYVKTLDVAVTKTFTETLRVEYDAATGKNLGALIEGGSTNLMTYSEVFGSSWSNSGTSVVNTNVSVAPDGTLSADKLSGADQMAFAGNTTYKSFNLTASADVTTSLWVKSAGAATTAAVGLRDGVSGAIGFTDYPITTEWQRITHTRSLSASSSTRMMIGNIDGSVYIWGAQCEVKPFATSYIRTEGSVVSRSADSLNVPYGALPDGNEVTVAGVFTRKGDSSAFLYETHASSHMGAYVSHLGTYIRASVTTRVTSAPIKNKLFSQVITASNGTATGYLDKIEGSTINVNVTLSSGKRLNIGASQSVGQYLNGHVLKLSTYAQVLTQQEITLL